MYLYSDLASHNWRRAAKNPQQHPAAPRGGICKQVNVTENTAPASGWQSQSGSAPKCLKLLFIEVAANHVCVVPHSKESI